MASGKTGWIFIGRCLVLDLGNPFHQEPVTHLDSVRFRFVQWKIQALCLHRQSELRASCSVSIIPAQIWTHHRARGTFTQLYFFSLFFLFFCEIPIPCKKRLLLLAASALSSPRSRRFIQWCWNAEIRVPPPFCPPLVWAHFLTKRPFNGRSEPQVRLKTLPAAGHRRVLHYMQCDSAPCRLQVSLWIVWLIIPHTWCTGCYRYYHLWLCLTCLFPASVTFDPHPPCGYIYTSSIIILVPQYQYFSPGEGEIKFSTTFHIKSNELRKETIVLMRIQRAFVLKWNRLEQTSYLHFSTAISSCMRAEVGDQSPVPYMTHTRTSTS